MEDQLCCVPSHFMEFWQSLGGDSVLLGYPLRLVLLWLLEASLKTIVQVQGI
jgi:hypothetical protein